MTERRQRIFSGSSFEERVGYARAVVDGDWVFVSGTTGFDYRAGTIDDDPVAQTHQCFANITAALAEAGAGLDDMVRIRIFVPEPAVFEAVADIVGGYCTAARPANTTVIAGLIDPRMKIEIEVTARRTGSGDGPPAA